MHLLINSLLNKTASPPQAREVPGQPTQDPSSSKSGEYEQMGRWKGAKVQGGHVRTFVGHEAHPW